MKGEFAQFVKEHYDKVRHLPVKERFKALSIMRKGVIKGGMMSSTKDNVPTTNIMTAIRARLSKEQLILFNRLFREKKIQHQQELEQWGEDMSPVSDYDIAIAVLNDMHLQ